MEVAKLYLKDVFIYSCAFCVTYLFLPVLMLCTGNGFHFLSWYVEKYSGGIGLAFHVFFFVSFVYVFMVVVNLAGFLRIIYNPRNNWVNRRRRRKKHRKNKGRVVL